MSRLLLSLGLLAAVPAADSAPAIFFTSRKVDAPVPKGGLDLLKLTPPRELANNAEIIAISGYEPTGTRGGPEVRLHIDRPGSRVLLVLSSYSRVDWQVSASAGTILTGIVIGAYEMGTVTSSQKVKAYAVRMPYAYKTDDRRFAEMLASLDEWFGVTKLDAFRGEYRIPAAISITALDGPHPELTLKGSAAVAPVRDVRFSLISTDYRKVPVALSGPPAQANHGFLQGGKTVTTGSGKPVYMLGSDRLQVQVRAGEGKIDLPLPARFPAFSWASDIAYDSRRNIVSVASFGGEGFLYRYDASKREWLDFRSLNNQDIASMTYDTVADRYVALTSQGNLLFLSPEGGALFERRIGGKLAGLGRRYDTGNSTRPYLALAAQGDDIALVYVDNYSIGNIWHYDLKNDKVALTYQK